MPLCRKLHITLVVLAMKSHCMFQSPLLYTILPNPKCFLNVCVLDYFSPDVLACIYPGAIHFVLFIDTFNKAG